MVYIATHRSLQMHSPVRMLHMSDFISPNRCTLRCVRRIHLNLSHLTNAFSGARVADVRTYLTLQMHSPVRASQMFPLTPRSSQAQGRHSGKLKKPGKHSSQRRPPTLGRHLNEINE